MINDYIPTLYIIPERYESDYTFSRTWIYNFGLSGEKRSPEDKIIACRAAKKFTFKPRAVRADKKSCRRTYGRAIELKG